MALNDLIASIFPTLPTNGRFGAYALKSAWFDVNSGFLQQLDECL